MEIWQNYITLQSGRHPSSRCALAVLIVLAVLLNPSRISSASQSRRNGWKVLGTQLVCPENSL